MPITQRQLEQRARHVGGSDVAAILNCDPYRNAYDVWLDKTGQLRPRSAGEAAEAGNLLEPTILVYAERQLGRLRRKQRRVHKKVRLAVNTDAIVVDSGVPVEAKTSGIHGPIYGVWGPEGTDEVPEGYVYQCHAHMMCCDTDVCHLPALLGGRGFVMYLIRRVDDLVSVVEEAVHEFWCLVETGTPPPDTMPHLEIIRRRRRTPKTTVVIPADFIREYQAAQDMHKGSKEAVDEAKRRILTAMGDADCGESEAGVATFYQQKGRETVDMAALRADGLYDKYVTRGEPFPVLRVRASKEER